jgi:hypothetical protein
MPAFIELTIDFLTGFGSDLDLLVVDNRFATPVVRLLSDGFSVSRAPVLQGASGSCGLSGFLAAG